MHIVILDSKEAIYNTLCQDRSLFNTSIEWFDMRERCFEKNSVVVSNTLFLVSLDQEPIDGFAVAKTIKENYENASVVLLSNAPDKALKVFEVSGFEFLRLPLNLEDFHKKIGNQSKLKN